MTALTAVEQLNTRVAGVLGRMCLGVIATFITASVVNGLGIVPALFQGFLGYVIIFLPLVMSLGIGFFGQNLSTSAIKGLYFAFASAMGLSLSLLFYLFTTASIVTALIGTSVSFGALAAWGYFTKRDLSGWGPFLFAGVIGLIIASIIGIFLESTALQMTINVLCIVIFLGMTAYDMNRMREELYYESDEVVDRTQWYLALSLYINFINIFTSLLQLIGNRE